MSGSIQIGPGVAVPLRHMTRHALITGATGTGKTVTAAAIVEGLDSAGVPVLVIDAKGDLESIGARIWSPWPDPGTDRAGLDAGRMGAELMARALDLSPAQSGALQIALAWAEDQGLRVACLEDVQAALAAVVAYRADLAESYGLVSPLSAAAVSRALLPLRRQTGAAWGPGGLDGFRAADLGGVTVWRAARLARTPTAYSAAVAALLVDLYESSAELGDVAAPVLAVLIDEAHLVFDGAPVALVRRLESVVRLIRSRGIALIFASQSPADLPDAIGGQLLTRIQHGLRAGTPRQWAGVRAAAEALGVRPEDVTGLGVGEALCRLPDAAGRTGPAKRLRITPGPTRPAPVVFSDPVPAPVPRVVFSDPVPAPAPRVAPIEVPPPPETERRRAGFRAWLFG